MNTAAPAKAGQHITLLRMGPDPNPVPPGSTGKVLAVQYVLGDWHIEVAWDNGRTLSLLDSVDRFVTS